MFNSWCKVCKLQCKCNTINLRCQTVNMPVKVFHVKHNLQGDTSHPWCVLRTPPGIQAAGLELGPSPSRCAAGDPLPLPGRPRRAARGPGRGLERLQMAFKGVGVPRALVTAKTAARRLFFW